MPCYKWASVLAAGQLSDVEVNVLADLAVAMLCCHAPIREVFVFASWCQRSRCQSVPLGSLATEVQSALS